MDLNIDYVAKLSRLYLSEDEKNVLKGQFGQILEYVEKLNELDTSEVNPTAHIIEDVINVYREDKAFLDSSISEHVLKKAPHEDDGYFIVPPVIE